MFIGIARTEEILVLLPCWWSTWAPYGGTHFSGEGTLDSSTTNYINICPCISQYRRGNAGEEDVLCFDHEEQDHVP
jgi:hypothetical protein